MAFNMDAAIRIAAKFQGLNDFKALTDRLLNVEQASQNSKAGLQQLTTEAGRFAQEAVRTAAGVRTQATALQDLGARARTNALEMRRGAGEVRTLGSALQGLRGQSAGALDGLGAAAVKATGSVRRLGGAFTPVEQQIAKARSGAEQFAGAMQQLRGQSAGALDGLGKSATGAANNIRELGGALAITDKQLSEARQELLALGASSRQTERAIEQQVAALKNLRSQAEVNGAVYQELSGDIQRLSAASKELGPSLEPGIRGLKMLAKTSAESAGQQVKDNGLVRDALLKTGDVYRRLGKDIDNLRQKASSLDLSKGLNVTPGAVANGVGGAIRNIVKMRQDLLRSMPGRVVLTGEGLAAAGAAGAVGTGTVAGLGAVASQVQNASNWFNELSQSIASAGNAGSWVPGFQGSMSRLAAATAEPAANFAQFAEKITAAQAKLQALAVPFDAIKTAITAIGPETAAAFGIGSMVVAGFYQQWKNQADKAQADLEASFKGISDSTQKVLQDLARIYDKVPNARLEAQQQLRDKNMRLLGESPSGSIEARRAANAVVSAEREIAKIQGEQNQLLDGARAREKEKARLQNEQRDTARQRLESQRKITEQSAKEREELQQASAIAKAIRRNQERTAPEKERQAEAVRILGEQRDIARQRLDIQRQLTEQARKEREELRQSNAIAGSIRRNRERVAREQANLRRRAAEVFPRPSVLALPAAGQTSAPGTGQAISGGAQFGYRAWDASIQRVVSLPTGADTAAAMRRPIGPEALPDQIERQRRQQIAERDAIDATTEARRRAKAEIEALNVEIAKSQRASNGSINSLERQRAAWQALQNAVNPAAPAYERARQEIASLDGQLKTLTTTQEKAAAVQRRSIGREAFGSALGTLAMGGGIQGAAGALAGGLAFGGGLAGLAAGAGISAVLGAGTLAARVGVEAETAQVRLKALTDQFGEYNQAQAAAARIAKALRISQTEATDSFSKLYAALRPTGVTLQEVEDAFVGFTAAARASGATATESSAALLQLKQALGSGVLQGDELRSLREQAPAAAQAIAREMGVTIGELKKLGSEGKITTDIVLRALAKLKNENLGKLNAQFNTSGQALADLRVATDEFGQAIARLTGPIVIQGLRVLTSTLRAAVNLFGDFNRGNDANQRATAEAARQTQQRFPGQEGQLANTQRSRAFFNATRQRLANEFMREQSTGDRPNASQLAQQQGAARERELGRQRAAAAQREKEEAERKKKADENAKTASRINELLRDNLRLNTDLGNIGKDRLSQLNAELSLLPQLLRLELQDLNANMKGSELSQARINTLLAAKKRSVELEDELKNVSKEINDIGGRAIDLRVSALSGLVPKESPLKQEIQQIRNDISEAERAAVDLLNSLNALGGTNPETGKARATIGLLRADLAAADPKAIASQRLAQGDVDGLKQQVAELQNAGRELSTLDQLIMKYGADWSQLDPAVRTHLSALAQQKDELQKSVDKTREWNDVMNQTGATISGVLTDLITGTNDWASSLSGALKSLANLLLQQSLLGLAGKDGAGFFSFLTGSLGRPSGLSSIVSGFDIPASQLPLGMAFANGDAFAQNGIQAFARGGIVQSPTLFKFAQGGTMRDGLMGEAGLEAIMPLRRLPSGRLGVEAANRSGAAPITVNVAVDARGTRVEGDQTEAAALGRVISTVVQAEIIKMQRPGGRLANTR